MTGLLISIDCNSTSHNLNKIACSTNEKDTSYDLILTVVNGLIKIIYYKLIQITMDALGLAKVFIDLIVQHSPPWPSQLKAQLLPLSFSFFSAIP